ncbi:hypothetical protein [Halapricum desulfuricans]|uniref:hypothetical protein n=1 Tax=Halapricum desulfuricans TaxID=2841257 RepID=UPI001E55282F|nr:hypothetical protein [Halapricum desulfuricans]
MSVVCPSALTRFPPAVNGGTPSLNQGARLDNETDLQKREGTTRPSWQCRVCETTVPSVVAERISHQKQNATD